MGLLGLNTPLSPRRSYPINGEGLQNLGLRAWVFLDWAWTYAVKGSGACLGQPEAPIVSCRDVASADDHHTQTAMVWEVSFDGASSPVDCAVRSSDHSSCGACSEKSLDHDGSGSDHVGIANSGPESLICSDWNIVKAAILEGSLASASVSKEGAALGVSSEAIISKSNSLFRNCRLGDWVNSFCRKCWWGDWGFNAQNILLYSLFLMLLVLLLWAWCGRSALLVIRGKDLLCLLWLGWSCVVLEESISLCRVTPSRVVVLINREEGSLCSPLSSYPPVVFFSSLLFTFACFSTKLCILLNAKAECIN